MTGSPVMLLGHGARSLVRDFDNLGLRVEGCEVCDCVWQSPEMKAWLWFLSWLGDRWLRSNFNRPVVFRILRIFGIVEALWRFFDR